MEPIRLTLHFNSTSISVKYFRTTPFEAFKAHVRELFGLRSDAPLRFRDAEGDVVFVDPAGMPPGISLHVAQEQGAPFTGTLAAAAAATAAAAGGGVESGRGAAAEAGASIPDELYVSVEEGAGEWCVWERHDKGRVSDDGLTFSVLQSDPWGFAAYTKALPTSGKHYFAIDFPARPCCVTLGLIPADTASVSHAHLAGDSAFPFLLPLMAVGSGPAGCLSGSTSGAGPMKVGVLVDMDERFMVLTNHCAPNNVNQATRLNNIPPEVRFVLTGPNHDIKATLQRVAPTGNIFCGAWAVADKVRMLQEKEEEHQRARRAYEKERTAAGAGKM